MGPWRLAFARKREPAAVGRQRDAGQEAGVHPDRQGQRGQPGVPRRRNIQQEEPFRHGDDARGPAIVPDLLLRRENERAAVAGGRDEIEAHVGRGGGHRGDRFPGERAGDRGLRKWPACVAGPDRPEKDVIRRRAGATGDRPGPATNGAGALVRGHVGEGKLAREGEGARDHDGDRCCCGKWRDPPRPSLRAPVPQRAECAPGPQRQAKRRAVIRRDLRGGLLDRRADLFLLGGHDHPRMVRPRDWPARRAAERTELAPIPMTAAISR